MAQLSIVVTRLSPHLALVLHVRTRLAALASPLNNARSLTLATPDRPI